MSGTSISNSGATETASSFEICQRSGKKVKRGTLIKEWSGAWVAPQYAEPRHPQLDIRTKPEKQRGALRPEPPDTFITTVVNASDL